MSTIVSTTDHNSFVNLLCLFFYDEVLDVESLQKSLEKTIQRVPIVSSTFECGDPKVKEDGTLNYIFKHRDPSKVKIVKKSVNDKDLSLLYLPHSSSRILSVEEGIEFSKYTENVDASASFFEPKAFGFESFKVCLIETAKSTKCILAVSFNHGIVDAFSVIGFMNLWSCIHDDELDEAIFKSFSMERPSVMIPNTKKYGNPFEFPPQTRQKDEQLNRLLHYHPYQKNQMKGLQQTVDMGFTVTAAPVQMLLHFPEKKIEELKTKIKDVKVFSSHDCVCAMCYKFWAAMISSNDDDIIPFCLIIDLRGRRSDLPKNYFGNAWLAPNMYPEMTRKEILESDLSFLVAKIREMIEKADDSLVEKANICTLRYHKEVLSLHRKRTLLMNDWRNFDRYKPAFNSKKGCIRYVSMPPQNPVMYQQMWFSNLIENDEKRGGKGIQVRIILDQKAYEKIKDLDWTNEEDILKISKLSFN